MVPADRGPGDASVEAGDHPQAALREEGEDHRAAKAQVAAARKLAWTIWSMLSDNEPYRGADSELSDRKVTRMERTATNTAALPTARDLQSVGEKLTGRAGALERCAREDARVGQE